MELDLSFIDLVARRVRALPKRHPLRLTFRAVKHSPRLLSDEILKKYLQYRLSEPLTIVVLGMHRSGTSFTTRAINLLGADVGSNLLGSSESNPAGHWEHNYSRYINKEMLKVNGGRWDHPPENVDAGLVTKFKIKKFLSSIHEGSKATAVWKDPRTILTFPVWRREMVNYVPVFVFRHPSSVASSLQRRDGFTKEKGLSLWLEYNRRMLGIDDCEQESYFLNFDGGPDHISNVMENISTEEGLQWSTEAVEFYDENIKNFDSCTEMSGEVKEVYKELRYRSE